MFDPTESSLQQGFQHLAEALERWFQGLPLQAADVPDDLRELEGTLRGAPIVMTTHRYHGAGYETLTYASIRQQDQRYCSITVVGLPKASSGLPVLGIDLIAFGGRLSLAAIDLAPTHAETWQRIARPLLEKMREDVEPVVIHRKIPAFTHETFSPLALIAAPKDDPAPIFEAVVELLHTLQPHLLAAPQLPDEDTQQTQETITRWVRSEHQNRKELKAFTRLFGEERAHRYLHDFLFAL